MGQHVTEGEVEGFGHLREGVALDDTRTVDETDEQTGPWIPLLCYGQEMSLSIEYAVYQLDLFCLI